MTSTTDQPPTPPPAQPRSHPILGFAAALDGALDRVAGTNPVFMTAAQKRQALVELTRESHRLAALRLRVLAAADLDDIGAVDGSASTGAWVSFHTRTDRPAAAAEVRLANALDTQHPATGRELATGEISPEHATVIIWAIDRLPEGLDRDLLAAAEKTMLEEAHHLTPAQLRIAGRHLLEVVAPDAADELLRNQLDADERAAYARTRFTTRANGDGTTAGWFTLPDLHASMLKAAIEAITARARPGRTGSTRRPAAASTTRP